MDVCVCVCARACVSVALHLSSVCACERTHVDRCHDPEGEADARFLLRLLERVGGQRVVLVPHAHRRRRRVRHVVCNAT